MTYELKGGEHVKDGKLHGWTGAKCEPCKGNGQVDDWKNGGDTTCSACGGTGDEYGLMPAQPKDLPDPNSAKLEITIWNSDGVIVVHDFVSTVCISDEEIRDAVSMIDRGTPAHLAVMLAKQHIPKD
jgi:hypothetical protein